MQNDLVGGQQLSGLVFGEDDDRQVERELPADDARVHPDQPVAGQAQLSVIVRSLARCRFYLFVLNIKAQNYKVYV
jgi:hypothetical protein